MPILRAAHFVQSQQHFARDRDLNPPLLQQYCDELHTALDEGEPVAAILSLYALRDRLFADAEAEGGFPTAGSPDDHDDDWRRHDPGPGLDDWSDAQPETGIVMPFASAPGITETDGPLPDLDVAIEVGLPIPTLDEEQVLGRLLRRRDDRLISPAADPLRFAQVTRHIRRMSESIALFKGHTVSSRRATIHLVSSME